MPMAGDGTLKLRFEAPAFIPSFINAESSARDHSIPLIEPSINGHRNSQKTQHRRQKAPQRYWKDHDREIHAPGRKIASVDAEASSKKVSDRHNTRKYNKGKIRGYCRSNHGRRDRQKDDIDPPKDKETADALQSERILPLFEDASFPLLDVFSAPTSETTIASNWLNSKKKATMIYSPTFPKDSPDETLDEFASLGLQKLDLVRTKKQKSKQNSTWDTGTKTTHTPSDDAYGNHSPTNQMYTDQVIQDKSVWQGRPQWNMNKLRNKWWDAIDRRKAKKNMMAELKGVLVKWIVDPDIEEVCSVEMINNSTAVETAEAAVGISLNRTECNFVPSKPSPLESIMNDASTEKTSSSNEVVDLIIRKQDGAALKELLDIWSRSSDLVDFPEDTFLRNAAKIMMCTVELELPQLLDIVLSYVHTFEPSCTSERNSERCDRSFDVGKAFFLAAKTGNEECISIFLTTWDDPMSLYSVRDDDGNSVFHHCCSGRGDNIILQVLLRHLSGGSKSKQQQLAKVLLAKNKYSQTALHVACEHGRVDFVETYLSSCSTSLLAKLLAMEDDRKQTPLFAAVGANASDVVMCLIMWRGNRNLMLRNKFQAAGKVVGNGQTGQMRRIEPQVPPCPMVWAAKNGNLDMIQLFLNDPSGKDYQVTESINALLLSDATTDMKVEGCHVLVQDGGNPFEKLLDVKCSTCDNTSVSIAAKYCETKVLFSLVTSGQQQLRYRQQERRKDPKLRQQPESFFKTMECKEEFEKERSLTNALVESLYRGCTDDGQDDAELSEPLASAVSLYMLGATLQEKDKARLQLSIKRQHLQAVSLFLEEPNEFSYITSYVRQSGSVCKGTKLSDLDRSTLSLHSALLVKMDWFQEQHHRYPCSCPWLSSNRMDCWMDDFEKWNNEEVILIAADRTSFTVHDSIVSAKSAKLASALRFASMKNTNEASDVKRVVTLNISSQHCTWMLQHIYHGSIACGWTLGEPTCHEILELMVVGEEFLCFSLVQECEMRLLALNPTACFCWYCAKNVKAQDDEIAECWYSVTGPSHLLSGNTALDVLAVLQHLRSGVDHNYKIFQVNRPIPWVKLLGPAKTWNQEDGRVSSLHAAVSCLKDAAIGIILSSFNEVVKSVSFRESVEWTEWDHDEEAKRPWVSEKETSHKILLLQMCLEELTDAALPKPYEKYQSSHKLSSMTLCQ